MLLHSHFLIRWSPWWSTARSKRSHDAVDHGDHWTNQSLSGEDLDFFFFISLNVSTSKQENGYEWGLRDWICRPTTHYWRTLTHDLCSNQPRMVKTWSMTVSFPIFAPSQNRPEKAKCFPNESCKMPFLVSLPPATPCQPPLITAYLEPLHTFFLLYQAFPLLCQPFESLSKTSESGSLLL